VTAFLTFFAAVPALWFVAEARHPYFLDPSYCRTRSAWTAAQATHPDSRTCVVIGSSRTVYGFDPRRVEPTADAAGRPVVWFNASHYEAGPGMNYVTLRRLLRDGPPPARVVVELMPAFCVRAEASHLAHHTTWQDTGACLAATPWGEWPLEAMKRRVWRLKDLWAELAGRGPHYRLPPGPLDGGPYPNPVPAEVRAKLTADQLAWLGDFLKLPRVHPGSEKATEALIKLCRDRGIELIFLRTPESTAFRAGYDPAGLARFDAWVTGLEHDFDVRVVDARDWIPDDQFLDGHHPTAVGTDTFTARLIRELGPPK
jgi:hypothetical protein